MRDLTHLGGNHQRRGVDVERAQLVGHDHIVNVFLPHFLQLQYEKKLLDIEELGCYTILTLLHSGVYCNAHDM